MKSSCFKRHKLRSKNEITLPHIHILYIYTHTYMHIYRHICAYMHIYIYIFIDAYRYDCVMVE